MFLLSLHRHVACEVKEIPTSSRDSRILEALQGRDWLLETAAWSVTHPSMLGITIFSPEIRATRIVPHTTLVKHVVHVWGGSARRYHLSYYRVIAKPGISVNRAFSAFFD